MSAICYVMGPTNAGKSTFLHFAAQFPWIGLVEVGKMMRAKYPPEHFAGQAAPAHTAVEAWQMFCDAVAAHDASGKQLILVDGQPRDMTQAFEVLKRDEVRMFLHLWAPTSVRTDRAIHRDSHDPAKLALSMQRLVNDDPQVYNVLSLVATRRERIRHCDTSAAEFSLYNMLASVCAGLDLPSPESPPH